jgi:hypothetical protein
VPNALYTVLVIALAAGLAAMAGWVAPGLLRVAAEVLDALVAAAAGLVLLPEYLLSNAARADGRCPSALAYEFGEIVAVLACSTQQILRRICMGLAKALSATPPGVLAVVGGGLAAAGQIWSHLL